MLCNNRFFKIFISQSKNKASSGRDYLVFYDSEF